MTPKLSVVINTYNEAGVLTRLLGSLTDLADEIVIIDTESTDNIKQVAERFEARLYSHKYVSYVEPVRNFSISKASGEWILILDADEEVGEPLVKHIKEVISMEGADYYRIPRKNIVFGKWLKHSRWWPDYNIRLFKKGAVSWQETIHSVPNTNGIGEDFEDKEEFAIIHHHYNTIEQYVERLNRYTTQQAKSKITEEYQFNWTDLVRKPVDEFLSRYFFGEGYKDGLHGLVVASLQALSELVVYAKVWEYQGFKNNEIGIRNVISEIKEKERDLHYWQNDALYKQTGSLTSRLKRKLRV